ncbi:MAG: NAD-dependent epimerase/dehydratase family protein [Elusimicrobiota bacterium]|jgi:UDP-glucose 4-epimerase|nr:NAD-dependent epimerase/dehydratase family protein [Elusimicrobiota bacterium]
MKILVTGGAGFIGSNIVDALIAKGDKVSIIDNLSTGNKKNINPQSAFYKADISNEKKVFEIFKKEKPEIVIHEAAQIDVRKSVLDPAYDAKVNIMGSINILKAAQDSGVKKIIFASSGGTIYGECGAKAPDENVCGNPLSPYGIAKFSVEFYIKFYWQIYGLKYTILRYANVFGPRQDPFGEAGVVAIFAKRMLAGEDIFIYGDGKQMRDYVFVGDVVNANLKALTKGDNQIINIGSQKAVSVLELAKIMAEITGYTKKPVMKPKRAGELFKNFLNCAKAKKVLNWKPQYDLKKGIAKTIEFFDNQRSKE